MTLSAADAPARAQRAQRHLRRGRPRRRAASDGPGAHQHGRAGRRRSATCASRGAATRPRSRCSARRRLAASSVQEERRTVRTAWSSTCRTSRPPSPGATAVKQGPVERVRIGFSPRVAAGDAGDDGPVAAGAVPPRVVAGWQRPDGRVRRAGGRSGRRDAAAPRAPAAAAAVPPAPAAVRPAVPPPARSPTPHRARAASRLPAAAPARGRTAARRRRSRRPGSRQPLHGSPGQPRLPGRRPARGAARRSPRSAA